MAKRCRIPKPKPGELRIYWGKAESYDSPQVCYSWGDGCSSADARLIDNMLKREFRRADGSRDSCIQDELVRRGYDLSTIKFSVSKETQPLYDRRNNRRMP